MKLIIESKIFLIEQSARMSYFNKAFIPLLEKSPLKNPGYTFNVLAAAQVISDGDSKIIHESTLLMVQPSL